MNVPHISLASKTTVLCVVTVITMMSTASCSAKNAITSFDHRVLNKVILNDVNIMLHERSTDTIDKKRQKPIKAKYYDWIDMDRGLAIRSASAASSKQNILIVLIMSDNSEHIAHVKQIATTATSSGRERIAVVRIPKLAKEGDMSVILTDGKIRSTIIGTLHLLPAIREFYDRDIE